MSGEDLEALSVEPMPQAPPNVRPPAPALACPQCHSGRLRFTDESAPWVHCDNCDHRVPISFAAELLAYDEQYRALFTRRDWLADQVAAGATSRYLDLGLAASEPGQPWRAQAERWTDGAVVAPSMPPPMSSPQIDSLTPVAVPPTTHRLSDAAASVERRVTVASALYLLGGALVVFAIVGLAALTWKHLGTWGQGALLLTAALALAAVAHAARRRVPGLALTLAVLATITVPITVLESTYQYDNFSTSWFPTLAAISGALFALLGWLISRVDSYAWALFVLAEIGFVTSAIALSDSDHPTWGSYLVALFGATLMTATSLLRRTDDNFRTAAFFIGSVGLMLAGLVAASAIATGAGAVGHPGWISLVGAACVLALMPVWKQRNAKVVMYFAWSLLFVSIGVLGFRVGYSEKITWWTPLPLFGSSLVVVLAGGRLLRHGRLRLWPPRADFLVATAALWLSVLFALPRVLQEGTGEWWWKAYLAMAALIMLLLRREWRRGGRDLVSLAEWSGWVLLTIAVASIGLRWLPPGVVPTPLVAIPLLVWSVILLTAQIRFSGLRQRVSLWVGVVGLAIATFASLFALSPVHRGAWAAYSLVVCAVLVIASRQLVRAGIASDIVSIVATVTLSLPFTLACVELGSRHHEATYVAAVIVSFIGGLVALGGPRIQTRVTGWNFDTFAAGVWVFGGIGIASNLANAEPIHMGRVFGTYMLIVATFLAIATAQRHWIAMAWVAALVGAVGWLQLFRTWSAQPVEVATIPLALMLLAAGLATWRLRTDEGRTTSSCAIFTPALVVGLLPSTIASWVTSDLGHPGTRWFVLVVVATTLTIAGGLWRLAGILLPAAIALTLALLPQIFAGGSQLLTVVPAWVFFAAIGAALIAAAARLEWLRGAGRTSRQWFATLT